MRSQVKGESVSKVRFKSCLTNVTVSSHARTQPRSEDGNVVSATAAKETRPTLLRVLTVLAVKTCQLYASTGRFQIFTPCRQKSARACRAYAYKI